MHIDWPKDMQEYDLSILAVVSQREDIVKTLYKTIPVTARDEEMLKELLNDGIEIEIRTVPGEQKVKSIKEHVRRKI